MYNSVEATMYAHISDVESALRREGTTRALAMIRSRHYPLHQYPAHVQEAVRPLLEEETLVASGREVTAEYARQARQLLAQYGPGTAYDFVTRRGGLEHYTSDLRAALHVVAKATQFARPPHDVTQEVVRLVTELRRGYPIEQALTISATLQKLVDEHGATTNMLNERLAIEIEQNKVRTRTAMVQAAQDPYTAVRAVMRGEQGHVRVDLATGAVTKR